MRLRSLNVAKSCPLDVKAIIALSSGFLYLKPDVLALSVAIGPDAQGLGVSCLLLDIFGNLLLVLQSEMRVRSWPRSSETKSLPRRSRSSRVRRTSAQVAEIASS